MTLKYQTADPLPKSEPAKFNHEEQGLVHLRDGEGKTVLQARNKILRSPLMSGHSAVESHSNLNDCCS